MIDPNRDGGADLAPGSQHLTTISHEGRFWDVYLEFQSDPRRPTSHRAAFAFRPGDPADGEGIYRTAVVIIEETHEDAVRKGRSFDDRHLASLLRSVLE